MPTFILDIGTRVVVGLLMEKKDEYYKIIASAKTEHNERAMYDGQVHNVDEVARAVKIVKNELEKKTGKPLNRVAIAAAGRTLKTQIAQSERVEVVPIRWGREDILSLELEAVQIALKEVNLIDDQHITSYHCVGYSTVEQWLDDEAISSLVGQRGRKARVMVIATFLPRAVVDGLLAVLDRVELQMESLTLEPIAAGLAAIPLNMRRMNLALVDIGAGTADIALTQNGTFFAFGMVPMAGDEITEAICNHFLLDFQTGEKVKKLCNLKKEIVFKNFFGERLVVSKDEVLEVIRPVIIKICENISREILTLNTSLPQGVILIGGGSLTPDLKDMLSEYLGIPNSRIGIQVKERISQVSGESKLKGPEYITSIGIGISTIEQKGLHYYTVKVNEVSIPIFELQLTTVAEALLAAGVQPRSFVARPGAALTFELNGKIEIIKGTMGEPSELRINGIDARLDQEVKPNDIIEFKPATNGNNANAYVRDIIKPISSKKICFNGKLIDFKPLLEINGSKASLGDQIKDGSILTYSSNFSLDDLLIQKGLKRSSKTITAFINNNQYNFEIEVIITVNGEVVKENCLINNGDRINYQEKSLKLKDINIEVNPLFFLVNGEQIVFPQKPPKFFHGDIEIDHETTITDGMVLRSEVYSQLPILSEVLPFTTIEKNIPTGFILSIKIDGKEAQFTTLLHPGAKIDIEWVPNH